MENPFEHLPKCETFEQKALILRPILTETNDNILIAKLTGYLAGSLDDGKSHKFSLTFVYHQKDGSEVPIQCLVLVNRLKMVVFNLIFNLPSHDTASDIELVKIELGFSRLFVEREISRFMASMRNQVEFIHIFPRESVAWSIKEDDQYKTFAENKRKVYVKTTNLEKLLKSGKESGSDHILKIKKFVVIDVKKILPKFLHQHATNIENKDLTNSAPILNDKVLQKSRPVNIFELIYDNESMRMFYEAIFSR